MERLSDIIFYSLEKSIKTYRQFAQKNISDAGFNITIDQWLVLKAIQEDSTVTQQQLALKVFKDFASITRIIELLVKNGYLLREVHKEDRRRFQLTLSKEGVKIIKSLQPIINSNRKRALSGISLTEIEQLQSILNKITSNIHEK